MHSICLNIHISSFFLFFLNYYFFNNNRFFFKFHLQFLIFGLGGFSLHLLGLVDLIELDTELMFLDFICLGIHRIWILGNCINLDSCYLILER